MRADLEPLEMPAQLVEKLERLGFRAPRSARAVQISPPEERPTTVTPAEPSSAAKDSTTIPRCIPPA